MSVPETGYYYIAGLVNMRLGQGFKVYADGTAVEYLYPNRDGWQYRSLPVSVKLTAGKHTILFAGTDGQYDCGSVTYGISNTGGVFSGNTVTKFGNHQNATAGTLTVTFAISGANPALLSVNANSSLTPSTGYPRITYSLRNLGQQAVAIQ